MPMRTAPAFRKIVMKNKITPAMAIRQAYFPGSLKKMGHALYCNHDAHMI